MLPVEPEPSRWNLRARALVPGEDLVAVGADLAPGTILDAYRRGLFPMGLGRDGRPPIGWWSPDPRGVLLPGGLHVSRSLRRSLRRFTVTWDRAFDEVVSGCADPGREGRWITPAIRAAYGRLHELGWAHSVEIWEDGALVGGLYGMAIGGLFAGESMFHRAPDASKAAVVALYGAVMYDEDPRRLIDVQWRTDHLASLGVVAIRRGEYLDRLRAALALPHLPTLAEAHSSAGPRVGRPGAPGPGRGPVRPRVGVAYAGDAPDGPGRLAADRATVPSTD